MPQQQKERNKEEAKRQADNRARIQGVRTGMVGAGRFAEPGALLSFAELRRGILDPATNEMVQFEPVENQDKFAKPVYKAVTSKGREYYLELTSDELRLSTYASEEVREQEERRIEDLNPNAVKAGEKGISTESANPQPLSSDVQQQEQDINNIDNAPDPDAFAKEQEKASKEAGKKNEGDGFFSEKRAKKREEGE